MAKKTVVQDAAPAAAQTEEQITYLDPGSILADDNSRYGLKKSKIDSLAESIRAQGVQSPIEVEPLPEGAEAADGCEYRLTAGFYRLAAVMQLNEKEKLGLTIPAIIRPVPDATTRLMRQLAENMERENQSPMDKAVAIRKLLDAGVPKPEIRRMFAAIGGRKGNVITPMSNSFLNMTVSFLELPKPIQTKIHEGQIGVAAAYQLTKVKPEDRAAVMDAIEADRLKQVEKEEKEEEKFLEQERKLEQSQAKQVQAATELDKAKLALEAADKAKAAAAEASLEAYKAAKVDKGSKDDKEKAAKAKALKDAEAAKAAADKEFDLAAKAVEKLTGKVKSETDKAAERAKKLADARKAAEKDAKAGKATGATDVKKAAKSAGVPVGSGLVPLNLRDIKEMIHDFSLAGSYPKVRSIGQAFERCLQGVITDKQLYAELAVITGEKKEKVMKAG